VAFEPAYLRLAKSELKKRVEQALTMLAACRVCPRNCGVDRLANKKAFCGSGRGAVVSSCFAHFGEEDCLRGRRGSGTIFFSMCNLHCVFCQNHEISRGGSGFEVSGDQLAEMMLDLQAQGCHNINFVTPEHVVPQMLEALLIAVENGLALPLVYNTSAYDSLESLHLLDGVIDIYMPDFKFWDSRLALKYLKAADYPQTARESIKEMHRQTGDLSMDADATACRGVLLRHLVMPGRIAGTPEIMQFLSSELSRHTYVNIMGQYHPDAEVNSKNYAEINSTVTASEMDEAYASAISAGLYRFDKRRYLLLG
jgi:putative pyruvate formate lyase activating enzyme